MSDGTALAEWPLEPPAFLHVPKWEFTRGPEVADLCDLFDFPPDAEQELILDNVFAVGSDGLPAAEQSTVIAARQNIKSSGFEMVGIGWLFLTMEQRVLWSAHEYGTTRDSFVHLAGLIEAKPWAMRKVERFYTGSGNQSILLRDGRRMDFVARTTAGGRGKVGPKMILDEALELLPEHMAAVDAITSTFPWAQKLFGSSACKPYSSILRNLRDDGRAGNGSRSFFAEWCDDLPGECQLGDECSHARGTPGCKLDDERRWKRGNPALGRIRPSGRGLTVEALRNERSRNTPEVFARERLGWHDEPAAADSALFTSEDWDSRKDPDSQIVDGLTFALDVTPTRSMSAIVAGGLNADGVVHVETTSQTVRESRQFNHRPGTRWVVPWFRSRLDAEDEATPTYSRMRVLVLAGSAAMSLRKRLEAIDGLELVPVPDSEWPAACGAFADAIGDEGIVHVGDPELTGAVSAVIPRYVGEKSFVWGIKKSGASLAPLFGGTLLHWDLQHGDYDVLDSIL